tara:strand:+ start:3451 stop:3618 length:168 start_codon:yes stop_codon:yes gene_type:complete
MDLILVLLAVAGIAFMSGFLLGMFLGDKYFYIDVKRKEPSIPEVKGTVTSVDTLA